MLQPETTPPSDAAAAASSPPPAAVSPAAAGAARPRRWRHVAGKAAVVAIALAALTTIAAIVGLEFASRHLGPPPIAAADDLSTVVLDRKGRLLRAFTTAGDRWRLPVASGDVDQRYLAMLMAFEDKSFMSHGGVDGGALLRAAGQFALNGRIVSGGSTLTMQVARLLEQRHDRTLAGKLRQIVRARQLERLLTKTQILDLYLRLAPFGGNLEGVRAASLAYFGKEPSRLSIGEAALLVALPQSPEARRPDRFSARARAARDRVLERAAQAGVIKPAEAVRARAEPVPKTRRAFPLHAPHLAEAEAIANPRERVHRLTIDRPLQQALEQLVRDQAVLVGKRLSAAILVADHTSGAILAHVGAADYLDQTRFGAIDMVSAVRSPGSTLKPFIYGLAFEQGLAHPETLIEDRPVRFGTYTPKNFDEDFRGTVTIRSALAHSLNIPAVKVLDKLGPARLVARFRRAGFEPDFGDMTEPSLAVALGGVGFTMRDLAGMYAAVARGGEPIALRHRTGEIEAEALALRAGRKAAPQRRLLSPAAAWYVTDILKDAPPPASARGGRIAYKTGTSYGYRDAWAIGYDGRHVVAVWIGRPDNASTPGMMGHGAAAPILFDAFERIAHARTPLPPAPGGVMRVSGSELPPPLKRFAEPAAGAAGGPFLEQPLLIAFPPDRSDVEVVEDDGAGEETAALGPLLLKAEGGTLPLTWLADGRPIGTEAVHRQLVWQPAERGFVKLSVIDARGRVDRVTVRLR